MAKSSVLSMWEELFGDAPSPSSQPDQVTGYNADPDSTVKLVNASRNPLRGKSVFDDGWTENKPMPLRATEGEDGSFTAGEGDIAGLWKMTLGAQGGFGKTHSTTEAHLQNTWDFDISSMGNLEPGMFDRFFKLAPTIQIGGGKAVWGKYRLAHVAQITDWESYNAEALRNPDTGEETGL